MDKKKDAGYHAAIGGAKKIIKALTYIFIILVIALLGKAAFGFGYDVFNQKAMDTESNAQEVTVTISEDMSVSQIGKMLKQKKLIKKPFVFWVQEKLSDYRGKIKPGIYELNTAQKVDEMLEIFAGEDQEEDGEE